MLFWLQHRPQGTLSRFSGGVLSTGLLQKARMCFVIVPMVLLRYQTSKVRAVFFSWRFDWAGGHLNISQSCFRIRVPFHSRETWFFVIFQRLTSAIIVDYIRPVQFRTSDIDWVWRRYSTTAIWVKYRAGRGAVLNWKGCEPGRIDQGVTNRLVARDRLLSFLVSQKPLHPVSRPGKITMVALVEMSW